MTPKQADDNDADLTDDRNASDDGIHQADALILRADALLAEANSLLDQADKLISQSIAPRRSRNLN